MTALAAVSLPPPPTHATGTPWGALFETGDFFAFLSRLEARYGDTVRTRIVHQWVYLLSGPPQVDAFLTGAVADFGKDTPGFEAMRTVLGLGLITSDGEHHQKQRRTLQPAFRRDSIQQLAATMDTLASDSVRAMLGAEVELFSFFSELTLRLVASTLLSIDVAQASGDIRTDLATLMREATRRTVRPPLLPDWLPTPSNRAFNGARKRLRGTVERLVAERLAHPSGAPDVLEAMIAARDPETGAPMSHEQLCDEVMTLFLAGHETQSVALTWTAALLETHAAERSELTAALGTPRETEALDAVLCESMRLYPPVWLVGRRALRDTTVGGVPVPARAIVLVSPYVIHRSAGRFAEPLAFAPRRWMPAPKLPRGAYLPFSMGPRKCIGDHFAMLAMRSIVRALYAQCTPRFRRKPRFAFDPGITLRPREELWAKLEPR